MPPPYVTCRRASLRAARRSGASRWGTCPPRGCSPAWWRPHGATAADSASPPRADTWSIFPTRHKIIRTLRRFFKSIFLHVNYRYLVSSGNVLEYWSRTIIMPLLTKKKPEKYSESKVVLAEKHFFRECIVKHSLIRIYGKYRTFWTAMSSDKERPLLDQQNCH